MRGFTLLELLVVVIIIAILLGAAMLSLHATGAHAATQWAGQAQAWIETLCDQALFQQQVRGWQLDMDRQALVAWAPSESAETPPDTTPQDTSLAEAIAEALSTSPSRHWQPLTQYAPLSWSSPLVITVPVETSEMTSEPQAGPRWRCWPTGEYVPGAFDIQDTREGKTWRLQWDTLGHFSLKPFTAPAR